MESLVQLIGFMDRHVLDSASLTMQETPVSVCGGQAWWIGGKVSYNRALRYCAGN